MNYHKAGRDGPEKTSELGEVYGHLLFFMPTILAPASSYSTVILPWQPPLPDLGSYGSSEADPTPEVRGGHSWYYISYARMTESSVDLWLSWLRVS